MANLIRPKNQVATILVVEDEHLIADDIANTLIDLGYKVAGISTTAEDAIQIALQKNPSLILMDINLGGEIDGIMAINKIQQTNNIPVIYLTAYSDLPTLERAKKTEPLGYIIKPFEDRELFAAIEMALYKHKMQQKIKENEQWLSTTLKSIGEAVIAAGEKGSIVFMNPMAETLTEWKEKDAKGRDITTVLNITAENQNLFTEDPLASALKNGTAFISQQDSYLISKSSNKIPIKYNISPIKSASGNINGIVVVFHDITEQKKSETALKEREENYRSLIDSSIDAIFVLKDKRFLLVNKAWTNLFGYSAEEACSEGFDIFQIIAPESRSFIEDQFKNIYHIKKSSASHYEIRGVSKNGKLIDLEVSVKKILWNGEEVFQGIYRDITERRRVEGIFSFLSHSVEQSPASIVITNTSGEIKYVNPKFTRQTGYSLKEVYGKPPHTIGWGETSPEEYKRLWKTISDGSDWRGEFYNRKKSGEYFWELASISPIRNEHGEIAYFLAVTEDITDRKQREEQLIKAKENAERSDKLKTEFLTQMSHEIRTPLNNITTFISLLKDELEDKLPESLGSTFKIIDISAKRIIRTIELILNLSKIHTDNFDTNFRVLNISKDIVDDLMLEFHSRAKEKNLKFKYINKAAAVKVYADHYSISQAFNNILDNAIKYTPKGKITVKLFSNDNNQVCLEVTDTGIGISEEYLPNIFNPFSQEDMSNTRKFEGTGLGLALVKKYVVINGGEIFVESIKGKGSKFTIVLAKYN